MNRRIREFIDWLKRLLTTPTAELNRWQFAMRFLLELCRQGGRQLREHRAGEMAAALAFRTLFGLIPVVIIAAVLFRAFGGADLFANLIEQLLQGANLQNIQVPSRDMSLADWARQIIQSANAQIAGRAVGLVGSLLLAWAAVRLISTIERCFNVICHAPQDRAIFRRIPLYWTAVTVGPVLLYSSFRFQHRLVATVEHLGGGGQVASIVGFIFALLSTWLFLLGLYKLMPYTKVDTTAAAIGSIIATVFWTIVTHLFGAYVNWSFSRESSTFTVVYGSLGLIPLFMLWIHALWVIVLYGLEVTRTLMIVGVRLDRGLPVLDDLPPMTDPASIVPVVKVIADRFEQGRLTDVSHIVDRTHFSPAAVEILLKGLVQDGVIYRVDERRRQGFSLARPPARITTDQLMQTAMRLTDAQGAERSRAWDWINRFRADVLKVPSHAPIADM